MREGVTFESGNAVTAQDAEWSLRRAVTLHKTPSFILTQFGFTAENVGETIVADGNTISITTDRCLWRLYAGQQEAKRVRYAYCE